MHNIQQITDRVTYVGGNDRKAHIFEAQYPLPGGMAYNNYVIKDEKTVLMDTADMSVFNQFVSNVEAALHGSKLDYIVVQHMEPDHSASLLEMMRRYPEARIVCSARTKDMIAQFFGTDISDRSDVVGEGDKISTGSGTLSFITAPMVHWPEVIMTYYDADRILFCADAFGSFGSLDGSVIADSDGYDYDEARRYYTNIVGKYGNQVGMVLGKASSLDIGYLCPLHGHIWKDGMENILDRYRLWSTYAPECDGVLIIAASVYGNTMNAAEIFASKLAERGCKVRLIDVSMTHHSYPLSEAFRYGSIAVFTPTVDASVFPPMEDTVNAIISKGLRNRKIAVVDNGSWAPVAGKSVREKLAALKDVTIAQNSFSIRSALTDEDLAKLDLLAAELA